MLRCLFPLLVFLLADCFCNRQGIVIGQPYSTRPIYKLQLPVTIPQLYSAHVALVCIALVCKTRKKVVSSFSDIDSCPGKFSRFASVQNYEPPQFPVAAGKSACSVCCACRSRGRCYVNLMPFKIHHKSNRETLCNGCARQRHFCVLIYFATLPLPLLLLCGYFVLCTLCVNPAASSTGNALRLCIRLPHKLRDDGARARKHSAQT